MTAPRKNRGGRPKRHDPEINTKGYSMAKVLGRTEAVLDERAKARRRMFALSYVEHGCNGRQAAIAIGIPPASAAKQACEMLREPYTRKLVEELTLQLVEDRTRMAKLVRLGMFREANYMDDGASHGARVSAFAHLGRWYGVDPEPKPRGADTPKPGHGAPASGVMEIPLAANMEEWTQAAALSQAKLLEDVRK